MNYQTQTKDELIEELLKLQKESDLIRGSNTVNTVQVTLTKKALEESEIKYRELIENSPDAITIYSEGKIILVNKECLRLMAAKSAEELVGKHIIQFVHPDSRALVIEQMRKAATEGVVLPLAEEKFIRLDGSLVDVEVKAMPIRINSKPAVQLIVRDITKRKRMFEALRESEAKYRLIFENAPLGLLQFDDKGIIVTCNEMFAQIIGSPIGKLVGLNMLSLPDKKLVIEIEKTLDGRIGRYEGLYQSFTASKITYLSAFFAPMEVGDGTVRGGVGIIKDITERMQAKEELEESNEKYRGLSEAAFESIFLSERGICIEQNLTAQKTFGYSSAEAIGRYGTEWIVPEDREMVMEHMLRCLEEPYEATALRKDRTTFPCQLRGRTMHYKGREVRVTSLTDISIRKQVEAKIAEKEYLISRIAESSPNLIYIYDVAAGHNIYTNGSISKLLGYPEDELTDNDANFREKLVHPDDLKQFEIFDKNLETWEPNKVFDFEYRLLSHEGKWLWFKGSEKEFQRLDGKIVSLVGTVRDITTEKLALVALRESEAKYRALADYGFEGIIIINLEGNILFANPSLIKTFEYETLEEIIGKNVFGFIAPESIPLAIEDLTKMAQGVELDVAYYVGITSKGNKIWFESIGKIIDYEGVKADLISVRDVTAKKAAEDLLRESEEKFRLIAENTGDTITMLDMDLNVTYVSPSIEKLCGLSVKEVTFQNIRNILHPNSVQKVNELFAEIIQLEMSGDSQLADYPLLELEEYHQNGNVFWMELAFSFLKDSANKPIGIVTISRDITERKKAEKELIAAKEKAEESDRLKTAFLQGVSHEIRTPMNGILGFAGLLKEVNFTGDEKEEYIRAIDYSGKRMLNTIGNIVDTALIQSGQMPVSISETNINNQIEQIFNLSKAEAKQKGIEISCQTPANAEDIIINTDEGKLFSVLSKLVNNALKFTDHGKVEFGFKRKDETSKPAGSGIDDELEFYVTDTGIGIPADRQKAIFENFEHADIANARAFQGVGLGLSISKAYVEMLGGKIGVESKAGNGTTFYFTLPVK